MALTKQEALLVAARAMDIFVAERLLIKDAEGNVITSPAAPDVKIDLLLKDLDEDDRSYGLHAIRFILLSLREYCNDLGHKLALTKVDIMDDAEVETLRDLGVLVKIRAKAP